MTKQHHIPLTPVNSKHTRFDQLIRTLCQFIALAEGGRIKLRQQQRINPQQDFKLITEMSFARGVVMHMAKVSQIEYQSIIGTIQKHPEYDKSVDEFCDDFAPPKSKLITVDEFAQEQILAKAQGRMAPRGLRRV
jgi:hypothetical protein